MQGDVLPDYGSHSNHAAHILLNLMPYDTATFQTGYLGHSAAQLKGELQLKFGSEADRQMIGKVELRFEGIETAGDSRIELYSSAKTLWSASAPSTSQTAAIPTSLTFALDLTSDLPHCVHMSGSAISYRLLASLYALDQDQIPVATCESPVHLERYCSLEPNTKKVALDSLFQQSSPDFSMDTAVCRYSHPVPLTMTIKRTLFHRSEPIPVRIRIPPPDDDLIARKGLQLRSIEISLVRKISVPSTGQTSSTSSLRSRTGKSCRFSSARTLSLLLTLPPPSPEDFTCESISQSTILHDISFSLKLTISVTSSEPSDRTEVSYERGIGILPDLPENAYPGRKMEKRREADMENAYRESRGLPAIPRSNSQPQQGDQDSIEPAPVAWLDALQEEEYDGYEESTAADSIALPPPPIEEDISPPELSPTTVPPVGLLRRMMLEETGEEASSLPLPESPLFATERRGADEVAGLGAVVTPGEETTLTATESEAPSYEESARQRTEMDAPPLYQA